MTRNHIFLKARAKINIAIDVLGKRPDGYHELAMIMQSVSLYDGVFMKKVEKKDYLKLVSNLPYLPVDERNLAFRAIEAIKEAYGLTDGVFAELYKQIPVAAGLGGGSADCAAVLVGMRNLYGIPAAMDDLIRIGGQLGADVPFCVMRGTALAEGIGEKLTSLKPFPSAYVLLAKPPVIVSTADIFKAFRLDQVQSKDKPDIEKLLFYFEKSDLKEICSNMRNALESVTEKLYPVIGSLKEIMLENGALGALMSGSGPSVFGIFSDKSRAKAAEKAILQSKLCVREVFLSQTFNTASGFRRSNPDVKPL